MKENYPETLNGVRKLFGRNLRRIRMEKNLFQKEIAEIFGVKTPHIYALERGVFGPSLRNLCVLANLMEVGVDEFLKPCAEPKIRDISVRKNRIKRMKRNL